MRLRRSDQSSARRQSSHRFYIWQHKCPIKLIGYVQKPSIGAAYRPIFLGVNWHRESTNLGSLPRLLRRGTRDEYRRDPVRADRGLCAVDELFSNCRTPLWQRRRTPDELRRTISHAGFRSTDVAPKACAALRSRWVPMPASSTHWACATACIAPPWPTRTKRGTGASAPMLPRCSFAEPASFTPTRTWGWT